jgi:hypothetical protein
MKFPEIVYFSPEQWGQLERFERLYHGTYKFPNHIRACIGGTSASFRRAIILVKLAESMIGGVKEDYAELENYGISGDRASSNVTAVTEAAIISLYSSIDSARKIVTHIYSKCRGLPDSTRKTFQGAANGTIDERVPEGIRTAFRDATWYPPFRQLRDVLTHVGPGGCHFDVRTEKVAYCHSAILNGDRVLHIPDIFGEIDIYAQKVNQFLGQIFGCLNQSLNDEEVWQLCGVFLGRTSVQVSVLTF